MKLSKEEFIEQYIYYILEMQKAMSKNNYRKNNRYALRSNKLIEKYESEHFFKKALCELMNNDNLEIASNAAADSLRRNINIDKAITTLEEISRREDAGMVGFISGVCLKTWRERGAEGIK